LAEQQVGEMVSRAVAMHFVRRVSSLYDSKMSITILYVFMGFQSFSFATC